MRTFVSILLALGFCAAIVSAENWPRFRGDGQASVLRRTCRQWSAATTSRGNRDTRPGLVLADRLGRSRVSDDRTDGGVSCRVLCLGRKDGKVL